MKFEKFVKEIGLFRTDPFIHLSFLPGLASKVSNLTHQWSRAVIEIGVSYDENSENVLAVLKEICQQMYQDEQWHSKLIEEPVPQGILSFGDSAINFRILAKTAPGKQWEVDRELKNRIKKFVL